MHVIQDLVYRKTSQEEAWLQRRGNWPRSLIVVLHHFSSAGIFPWSMLDRGQQRSIAGGAVSEGGAAGSPLHHSQTRSSTNRARSSISERGVRDHFLLGPHRGERGRINGEADGRWRREGMKQKLHLGSRAKRRLSLKRLQRLNR